MSLKNRLSITSLLLLMVFNASVLGQKHFIKNDYVRYDVRLENDFYTIDYTFKDHFNNYQNYTIKLPQNLTDTEISLFGIPQWIFEPYTDSELNRMVRNKAISDGFFMMDGNTIEVDKNAVIAHYAETFCKPVAELIVHSLEEYSKDTKRDRIEMAMRFVQDIPYGLPDYDNKNIYQGGVFPPPGVLINGYGDCDSKALLFAAILVFLIPVEDIVFLNQSNHVLSAIRGNAKEGSTFINYGGYEYLLAETAGPAIRLLGEKGEYFRKSWIVEPLTIPPQDIFPIKTTETTPLPFTTEKPIKNDLLVLKNSSDLVLRFQLSLDNVQWNKFFLNQKCIGHYKFEKETLVLIRIQGKNNDKEVIKIQTGNTYQVDFNTTDNKWNLFY